MAREDVAHLLYLSDVIGKGSIQRVVPTRSLALELPCKSDAGREEIPKAIDRG
ncbi:hypothetical protein GS881_23355 [Rhodococcus hoagii]|nr:hypothetical protein [Prescottella equi]